MVVCAIVSSNIKGTSKVSVSDPTDSVICNFVALDQQVMFDAVPTLNHGIWCNEIKDWKMDFSDVCGLNSDITILIG